MKSFIIKNVPLILKMRLNKMGGYITRTITAIRNACSILIRQSRGRDLGVDENNIKMDFVEIVLM
jgi:hypothetical protein